MTVFVGRYGVYDGNSNRLFTTNDKQVAITTSEHYKKTGMIGHFVLDLYTNVLVWSA